MAVSISASASAPNRLDKREGYTIINNLQPFGGFKKSLDSCTLSTEDIKDFNTFNVLFKTRFFLVFAIAYCLREIVIAKIYWQVTMGLLISSERINLFFVCPAKCNKGFVFFMLCSELLRILDAGRRKMQFKVTDAFCICSWAATILLQWIDNFKSRSH